MIDAHNHLQQFEEPVAILEQCLKNGVSEMLVNGTAEADWLKVAQLADVHGEVIPAFGLHPWEVPYRSSQWLQTLRGFLEENPRASLGECGLDRWKKPFDLPDQIACLREQITLAVELRRPLTLHCLQAWGPLLELLQSMTELPSFLLHAYGGSTEMVTPFVDLGAYFSFNGYFLHERKAAVRETFRHIPTHRILLESDGPSMLPPEAFQIERLPAEQNHPANLKAILPALAEILALSPEATAELTTRNFNCFYSSGDSSLATHKTV